MASQRKVKIAFAALFLSSFIIADMQMMLPIFPNPTLLEKRSLAPLPAALSEDLPQRMDEYINDNFGFRKLFIRLSNYLDVKIFKTPAPGVILGNNDFLFMGCDWDSYVHNHGQFTNAQLKAAAKRIRRFQDELESRGVEFLLVIAPNKGTIHPEFIPKPRRLRNAISERQRIYAALASAGVNQLDLAPLLLGKKSEGILYYKGDHHWNKYGALIASRAIAARLAEQIGQNPPEFAIAGAKPDEWEAAGGGSIDELLGVKTIRANEEPIVSVAGQKLPAGAVMGDSFINWLFLDRASDKVENVRRTFSTKAEETARLRKTLSELLNNPEIRYFVAQYWEANQAHIILDPQWDFDFPPKTNGGAYHPQASAPQAK